MPTSTLSICYQAKKLGATSPRIFCSIVKDEKDVPVKSVAELFDSRIDGANVADHHKTIRIVAEVPWVASRGPVDGNVMRAMDALSALVDAEVAKREEAEARAKYGIPAK